MGRAKRKRKNAMKRHQTQTIEVNVDVTPMVQSTIEGLKVSLQPSIDQWAQQLAQSVVNQATSTQDDPADYAPLPDLDDNRDDDAEAPDDSREDGESMGDDEDTDAWQEDEKLAYGDDWDGLGNEDDEDDDDNY